MKKEPLISVIVPVYNVGKYLQRCLNSIIDQTYKNVEVILIDDGSTDGSEKICNEYAERDKRIKVFSQSNRGVSVARNVGLKKAKGEYIAFVDSDDCIDVSYLRELYSLMKNKSGDVSIVGQKVVYETDGSNCGDGVKRNTVEHVELFNGAEATELMLYQKKINSSLWGKLFKKELFDGVSFPDGMVHEDLLALYYIFKKAKRIILSDVVLYFYYSRQDSLLNGKRFDRYTMDILEIMTMIERDVLKTRKSLLPAVESRKLNAELFVIRQMPKSAEYLDARKNIVCDIKKNRMKVLHDPKVRFKTKVGIILTFFGISFMAKAYNILNKLHIARTV